MKRLIQWHKERIECVQDYFELSQYQLLWATAVKCILIGYIVGKCL